MGYEDYSGDGLRKTHSICPINRLAEQDFSYFSGLVSGVDAKFHLALDRPVLSGFGENDSGAGQIGESEAKMNVVLVVESVAETGNYFP